MPADINRPQPGSARESRFDGPPGLSGTLWPVHPHRLKDELLSSWAVRTAYANRLKLQSFTTLALGRQAALWNRDIDRSANDELLAELSEQTGSPIDDLRAGMLTAYETSLFARHNPSGNTSWIMPLGIYHRQRKKFGMQFCPLCLATDEAPYYRRRWRLASSTLCDVHGTMLHDRCPQCRSPVIFYRNDLGHRHDYRIGDLVSCWHCGFDLRRASAVGPSGPDWKSLIALRTLATFPDLGWWFQENFSVQYGPLYFDALHHLTMLLALPRGKRLLDHVAKETGWLKSTRDTWAPARFECRPIEDRHALLVAALWLLDDWPDRFIRAARSAGLTQSRILMGLPMPYWFESEIRSGLSAGGSTVSPEEAHHAADYLSKNGNEISGKSVGRLVGSKDALAVKPFAKQKQQWIGGKEFQTVIGKMDEEIHSLPRHSVRRLLLQRDRTILWLLQLTKWSARKTLHLTVGDAVRMASTPKDERTYPGTLAGLLLAYLRDTRRYLAGESSGDRLFIGWNQSGIGEKAWGLRVQRARRDTDKAGNIPSHVRLTPSPK